MQRCAPASLRCFVANDSRKRKSLPAGPKASPETPQEQSDEEAQAAPRGKRPSAVTSEYKQLETLDRDKAVK